MNVMRRILSIRDGKSRALRKECGAHAQLINGRSRAIHAGKRLVECTGFDRHLIKPIDISEVATLIAGLPARVVRR